jgi:glutamate--cysteine ligase
MNQPKSSPSLPAAERLAGMRRGVEKESLRVDRDGRLALTPHPAALGSALTHPCITTDFSESQLELITAPHAGVEACEAELRRIHQFVCREIAPERMWVSSMPCGLPGDETIPIGQYGRSNIGRMKSIYRMGLGHRYGRRMQTISGIHYNWSLPGLGNDEYLALIRNFRRQAFLLLRLFGASPAVCGSFVEGRTHALQPLGSGGTLHLPHATSLRMGRLGYQSDAQAALSVSYNSFERYADALRQAMTTPYPAYEAVGVLSPGGEYNQLSTSLLQIESEFYGTIRPKRSIRRGERPLCALRERGIEYVEVRCLDLDPFEPLGITAQTMRFLDVFLLHCLLEPSPPDTPAETAALARNQLRAAESGRARGLMLERPDGRGEEALEDWGHRILDQCRPLAAALDAAHGGTLHAQALAGATAALHDPDHSPSARVLSATRADHGSSFTAFVRAQSEQALDCILQWDWSEAQAAHFRQLAQASIEEQRAREAADTTSFEDYRLQYLAQL